MNHTHNSEKEPESVERLIEDLKRGRTLKKRTKTLNTGSSLKRPHSYHQKLYLEQPTNNSIQRKQRSASFDVKMNFLDEVEVVEKKFYAARSHFHQYWRQVCIV